MAPTASPRFKRSTNACDPCRGRKVKCTGKKPCHECVRRGVKCEFSFQGKKGYSKFYVESLLKKIKDQEDKLGEPEEDEMSEGDQTPTRESTPLDKVETAGSPSRASPVAELAPGPAFESRVRSIMRGHSVAQHPGDTPLGFTETPVSDLSHQWHHTEMVRHVNVPSIPPKDESMGLFNVFADWMGTYQHFLDLRTFVDGIDKFYQDEAMQRLQMQSIWFTQYLVVIALGMIIRHPITDINSPPGYTYFSEAMKRLPPRHELGLNGIISVEILALASVYMQWCDQKHDAYIYIGSALRLAIALGCSQPFEEQKTVTSERHHRTRLWWTVYVHDKRLASTLGLPVGADERQIRAELPKAAPGFEDPLPVIVNVQIARAMGEIMESLYNNTTIPQKELVKRIQTTLTTLHKTQKSITVPYHINFNGSRLSVNRTSATLYLMLFQAILLCIRPMLFQKVKDKIRALKLNQPLQPRPRAIAKLCHNCKVTASRTIQILSALRQDKRTSYFGYFEFDAAFAAAFILVMEGFLESENLKSPPVGLSEAAENLQHMSRAGSKVAQRRLEELRQFCCHIWSPDNMSEEWEWLKPSTEAQSSPLTTLARIGQATAVSGSSSSGTPSTSGTFGMDSLAAWQHSPEYMDWENFQADLNLDVGDIYSCYNDPALPLTGDNDADWAEVNKLFLTPFDQTQGPAPPGGMA